jgi:hypothetical protein
VICARAGKLAAGFFMEQRRLSMAMTSAQVGYPLSVNQTVSAAPRTIASAIGRVDGLNERLAGVRIQLTNISEQIGGPREVCISATDTPPSESNTVCRLNDSAERAHECMSDIESLLGCIGRALG